MINQPNEQNENENEKKTENVSVPHKWNAINWIA